MLQDGCGVKSSRNLGLFKQRQFEVVCNPILNLWPFLGQVGMLWAALLIMDVVYVVYLDDNRVPSCSIDSLNMHV